MKRYILAAAALSFCVACEQHVVTPEVSSADKAPAIEEKKPEVVAPAATAPAETPAVVAPAEETKPEAVAPAAPAAEEKAPEAPSTAPNP